MLSNIFRRFKQGLQISILPSDEDTEPNKTEIAILLLKTETLVMLSTKKKLPTTKNIFYERFLFYTRPKKDRDRFDHSLKYLEKLFLIYGFRIKQIK